MYMSLCKAPRMFCSWRGPGKLPSILQCISCFSSLLSLGYWWSARVGGHLDRFYLHLLQPESSCYPLPRVINRAFGPFEFVYVAVVRLAVVRVAIVRFAVIGFAAVRFAFLRCIVTLHAVSNASYDCGR
jgi:hypothetical protein